ncbi:MAG TPA: hypothetical protein VKB78_15995 [Pirellulales bacterium]|nr:hypothetical protein [Pirellulales bacterium]
MEIQAASVRPDIKAIERFGAGPQWGIASMAIGGMIFIASPILLAFNTIFANGSRYGVPIGLAWTASMIGWSLVLVLAFVSIGIGVYGWTVSRRSGRSVAFGVAGTVMSAAAALGWLIAGIDLILVLASFS